MHVAHTHISLSPADDREGEGLKVWWPEAGEESTYSRMYGGYNTTCIHIEDAYSDRLWSKKEDCEAALVAPCIKRGCAKPERDSPKAETAGAGADE